jgi:membrane protease YdiL (CAAX protease family)
VAPAPRVGFAHRHPLIAYFLLTMLLSLLVQAPLIATVQGWWAIKAPFWLHYLASFGPMLAGITVTWLNAGTEGLRELWSRITRWRVSAIAFWFAVGSPLAMFLAAALVMQLSTGNAPKFELLGQINYMPYLGIWALVLWIATYGFGEEIGWRGFALPRLQNGRSALYASVLLWCMWIAWHVPAFFYLETYMAMGLAMLPLFAVTVLAGTIVLTWLYNTANGSVLMLAVWHGVFDFLSASKASEGLIAAVMSTIIMLLAVALVVIYKPANLSGVAKHTL